MNSELHDLIDISRFAAEHPRLVQGGGGNCSVKTGGIMWVKASGCFLEDVSPARGFAVVDAFDGSPRDESRGKASMETPLHTLLGSFVIHTHPIAIAALTSALESRDWFNSVFSGMSYIWVDYATPGKKLLEQVKSILPSQTKPVECVLFLQNHGLFVSAESKQRAMALHHETVLRAENFFGQLQKSAPIPTGKFLTPDHVIYGKLRETVSSVNQKKAVDETLTLVAQALGLISQKSGTPQWLPDAEVSHLLGMDEEKYRQQVWKKS